MSDYTLSDDLPRATRHARVFVTVVILLSSILYYADLKINDWVSANCLQEELAKHLKILQSILENLIAGATAALLLALTYRWIVTHIDPADRVIEIDPESITKRLLRNARATRSYIFIGNTASFVSTSALPVLIDSSRKNSHPRSLTMFLVDPRDEGTLRSYTEFKSRLAMADSRVADLATARWITPTKCSTETEHDITVKVLSAIYLAAFASTQANMTVLVYLRKSFTPMRADITDLEVVLTQESKSESAVAFSSRGHFYSWYQKEAYAQEGQSILINLSVLQEDFHPLTHPSGNREEIEVSLRKLLRCHEHLEIYASQDSLLGLVAEKIQNPSHQYQ